VNGTLLPLTTTDPLSATLALCPLATSPLILVRKSNDVAGGGAAAMLPPPPPHALKAQAARAAERITAMPV
jgi:hypothetical protein